MVILHLPGRLVLAKILFQFGAVDDHLVNLLLLFAQNTVDHIAVQLALLIQLPHLLGLGERRRGRLRPQWQRRYTSGAWGG